MPEFLQNRRNQIIIGVVVILLFGILAVVLNQDQTTPVQVDNTPVTLTWWKPFYGNEVYSEIIRDFKTAYGYNNVTINIVNKDYSNYSLYYRTLIADIAANAGPDIFTIRNDDLPAYQNFMAPINNFEGPLLTEYRNSFVPLVVRDTMVKDKVYAVTSYVDNLQLYYNPNILAQSQIALPPQTWDDLDGQLSRLNRIDTSGVNFLQSAIAFGTGYDTQNSDLTSINRFQDVIPALIFQNGGQLYDYQTSRSIFGRPDRASDFNPNLVDSLILDNNNPVFNAVRFYYDFADPSTTRYSWNTNQQDNITAFSEGKLAYLVHFSYMQDTIRQRNPRLDFRVSELPQVDENRKKTYGFFFMDGINRQLQTDAEGSSPTRAEVKKYRVAQDFLTYLTTESAQLKFEEKTSLPAAHSNVIARQLEGSNIDRVFAAGSLVADNYYKPDVDRVEDMWGKMMFRVIYENQPLSDSIRETIREYNLIVSSPPVLRG